MSAKLQLGRQTCSNASLRLYVNVRIHSWASYRRTNCYWILHPPESCARRNIAIEYILIAGYKRRDKWLGLSEWVDLPDAGVCCWWPMSGPDPHHLQNKCRNHYTFQKQIYDSALHPSIQSFGISTNSRAHQVCIAFKYHNLV